MKGPYERLKYDLRRLWECPLCKRRERSDGSTTFRICTCPGKGAPDSQQIAMTLLEEAGHRVAPKFKYVPVEEKSPPDLLTSVDLPSDVPLPPDKAKPATDSPATD